MTDKCISPDGHEWVIEDNKVYCLRCFGDVSNEEAAEVLNDYGRLREQLTAYVNRENGLEHCEACGKWFSIEDMHLSDVWLCDKCWKELAVDAILAGGE